MSERKRWRIRLANIISGHVNHYDEYFPTDQPPWPLTDEWLDATEAKCRAGLNDRFADDACAVMLNMVLAARELREALDGLLALEWSKIVVPDALVAADALDKARRTRALSTPKDVKER